MHFNRLTLLQYVSCVQKWLIWFYAVLLWLDSVMMGPCKPQYVRMFSVILQYKYLRNNCVHFVGLVSHEWNVDNVRNEQYKDYSNSFINKFNWRLFLAISLTRHWTTDWYWCCPSYHGSSTTLPYSSPDAVVCYLRWLPISWVHPQLIVLTCCSPVYTWGDLLRKGMVRY